jgi:hypothetical protein
LLLWRFTGGPDNTTPTGLVSELLLPPSDVTDSRSSMRSVLDDVESGKVPFAHIQDELVTILAETKL